MAQIVANAQALAAALQNVACRCWAPTRDTPAPTRRSPTSAHSAAASARAASRRGEHHHQQESLPATRRRTGTARAACAWARPRSPASAWARPRWGDRRHHRRRGRQGRDPSRSAPRRWAGCAPSTSRVRHGVRRYRLRRVGRRSRPRSTWRRSKRVEQRVRRLATSIVHHANRVRLENRPGVKVGGHQASSALDGVPDDRVAVLRRSRRPTGSASS